MTTKKPKVIGWIVVIQPPTGEHWATRLSDGGPPRGALIIISPCESVTMFTVRGDARRAIERTYHWGKANEWIYAENERRWSKIVPVEAV